MSVNWGGATLDWAIFRTQKDVYIGIFALGTTQFWKHIKLIIEKVSNVPIYQKLIYNSIDCAIPYLRLFIAKSTFL